MVIIGITFQLFLKGVVIFDAVLNDKLPISVTDFCKCAMHFWRGITWRVTRRIIILEDFTLVNNTIVAFWKNFKKKDKFQNNKMLLSNYKETCL